MYPSCRYLRHLKIRCSECDPCLPGDERCRYQPRKLGIRLDSGDLAYLSKKARKMLDEAGFEEATICASNDLDEYLIHDLKMQGAAIDSWGVGTNLITSKDCPSFGGVYKLAAIQNKNGEVRT